MHKTNKILLAAVLALCFMVGTANAEPDKESAKVIENGSKVSIEYTLYLDDGTKVDSNVGAPPLVYEHGTGMVIQGLETSLEGLKVGDTRKVVVPADEGYGEVDPRAFHEIPKDKIPADARKVGEKLNTRTPDGRTVQVKVHEVRDDTVVVDYNHPLAGKRLTFDVKVVDVQ